MRRYSSIKENFRSAQGLGCSRRMNGICQEHPVRSCIPEATCIISCKALDKGLSRCFGPSKPNKNVVYSIYSYNYIGLFPVLIHPFLGLAASHLHENLFQSCMYSISRGVHLGFFSSISYHRLGLWLCISQNREGKMTTCSFPLPMQANRSGSLLPPDMAEEGTRPGHSYLLV